MIVVIILYAVGVGVIHQRHDAQSTPLTHGVTDWYRPHQTGSNLWENLIHLSWHNSGHVFTNVTLPITAKQALYRLVPGLKCTVSNYFLTKSLTDVDFKLKGNWEAVKLVQAAENILSNSLFLVCRKQIKMWRELLPNLWKKLKIMKNPSFLNN